MKVEFRLTESRHSGNQGIICCINACGLTINVATICAFIPADGDLARMLISGETQGEHTEE
jgi:hypothetical protein